MDIHSSLSKLYSVILLKHHQGQAYHIVIICDTSVIYFFSKAHAGHISMYCLRPVWSEVPMLTLMNGPSLGMQGYSNSRDIATTTDYTFKWVFFIIL